MNILLVDDDRNLVTTLSHGLRKALGETTAVATCLSGSEALSLLANQAFDVVVSDFTMPGLPGLELLQRIRQNYREMILVLITAYGTDALEEEANQLGVGYITKPFEPSLLAQLIKDLIRVEEIKDKKGNSSLVMHEPGKPPDHPRVCIHRKDCMSNSEASTKHPVGQHNLSNTRPVAKIFVVCNQKDTAPVWGYILRQRGLVVILETSLENALDRWSTEMPDLVVIDLDADHAQRMALYQRFREVSVAPILLFLPTYHETEILDAYASGVDDVIVKPVSPAIFLAKIMAWMRRSWTLPINNLTLVKAGKHQLDPTRHCLINPDGVEIRLTNLEFRLLHLLMSRPGFVFSMEEIIESIWGGYGNGDQVLLKNVVYRLRKKIERDPSRPLFLQTWQGGYCFQG